MSTLRVLNLKPCETGLSPPIKQTDSATLPWIRYPWLQLGPVLSLFTPGANMSSCCITVTRFTVWKVCPDATTREHVSAAIRLIVGSRILPDGIVFDIVPDPRDRGHILRRTIFYALQERSHNVEIQSKQTRRLRSPLAAKSAAGMRPSLWTDPVLILHLQFPRFLCSRRFVDSLKRSTFKSQHFSSHFDFYLQVHNGKYIFLLLGFNRPS